MQPSTPLVPSAGENENSTGIAALYRTSVGKKAVMAVTGIILVVFVIGHLLGNLQLFQGEEAIDRYARFLRIEPPLLWTVRIVLLAAALLHIVTGTLLFFENRSARASRYVSYKPVAATFASRTMIYSGIIVMAFIIYHLLHLTLGAVGPPGYRFEHGRVFQNMVRGFQDPVITVIYVVGQLLLYFHLSHGVFSLFQSLGATAPKNERFFHRLAAVLAFLLAAGNIAMPLAVLFGLVRLP